MTGFQLRRSLFDETILQLQSMQRHVSTFTNPETPSEWRCLKPASRESPGGPRPGGASGLRSFRGQMDLTN